MRHGALSFLVQAALVAVSFAAPGGVAARGPAEADASLARHVHADGSVHVHASSARPRTGDGERPGARGLEAGHSIHGGASRLKALRPNGVSGVTNWVLLRCRYQSDWREQPTDHAPQFSKLSYFRTMFSAQSPGLAHYWNKTSYGKVTINASFPGLASESDATVGWRTLPQPNHTYGRIADPGGYVEIDSFDALTRDCAQVWDDAITFNANTYYAFVLDQSPGACGVGGSFGIGTRDGVSRVAATLIGPCHDDQSLWAHEMGHAFGLPHSLSQDAPTETWENSYDTVYDVMSAPSGTCGSNWLNNGYDPRTKRTMFYGCIPGQPLAYFKDRLLGWIPAQRAYRHPGGTRTITLERLASPGANTNYIYAEIPVSSTVYYTVEARLKTGLHVSGPAGSETITTDYDENIPGGIYPDGTKPAPGGVIVNKVSYVTSPWGGSYWQVQLMGTDGDGYWDGEGTILKETPVVNGKGEKWTDTTGKVSVQVDSRSGNTFSVTVTGPSASGHRFYPLGRTRILDTRTTTGGHQRVLGPNATMTFPVLGQGGIPRAGVGAVVLNLRALSPTAASVLTAYASGTPRPGTINLQVVAGRIGTNLVTVRPGADGRVAVHNRSGSTHLAADVVGYYGATTGGLGYQPVYPALLYQPTVYEMSTRIGPNATVDFQVTGRANVPQTGVSAAALQLGVEQPSAAGGLTVYASGAARPSWNDYAFSSGDYHTGMVISRVGTNGRVRVHNSSTAPVYVSMQILGWFGPGGALSFRPTVPARAMTTVGGAKLGGGATRVVDLTGAANIPANGPRAVLTNVSVITPDAASFIRIRPADEDHNYGGYDLTFRRTDANAVIAQVGTSAPAGGVRIINLYAPTHVAVDVFGWFGEPY